MAPTLGGSASRSSCSGEPGFESARPSISQEAASIGEAITQLADAYAPAAGDGYSTRIVSPRRIVPGCVTSA